MWMTYKTGFTIQLYQQSFCNVWSWRNSSFLHPSSTQRCVDRSYKKYSIRSLFVQSLTDSNSILHVPLLNLILHSIPILQKLYILFCTYSIGPKAHSFWSYPLKVSRDLTLGLTGGFLSGSVPSVSKLRAVWGAKERMAGTYTRAYKQTVNSSPHMVCYSMHMF